MTSTKLHQEGWRPLFAIYKKPSLKQMRETVDKDFSSEFNDALRRRRAAKPARARRLKVAVVGSGIAARAKPPFTDATPLIVTISSQYSELDFRANVAKTPNCIFYIDNVKK